MVINQKLICVDTKTIFSNKLSNGEISNSSIVFIKDTGEIWTHGKYFGLSSISLDGYVTLDTEQNISGLKNFRALSIYGGSTYYTISGSDGLLSLCYGTTPGISSGNVILSIFGNSDTSKSVISTSGAIIANGFTKSSSSDSYVLLGGGGHKPLSELEYDVANYNTLGLIKPRKSYTTAATFSGDAISSTLSPSISSITTTAGRYYAVEIDSNGVPFVNVPWVNTGQVNTDYRVSSGNTTMKIFLVGTTTQATTTSLGYSGYSNSGVYASGGYLYSGSTKVKVITDNFIDCDDTRNVAYNTSSISKGLYLDFKSNSASDLTATYASIITIRPLDSDFSGGIHQLAFDANGIHYRNAFSADSWSDWKGLAFGDFLPLSGGTMTGTINARSIIPTANSSYSLGSPTYKWNYLYANYLGTSSYPITTIYASTIRSKGHIYPALSNAYDLGTTSYYFRDVYAYGFKRNGSSNSYVLLGGGGHKALSEFFSSTEYEFSSYISTTNVDSYGMIMNKTWGTSWDYLRGIFLIKGNFGTGILSISIETNGSSVFSANINYSGAISSYFANVQDINHYIKVYYNKSARNIRMYYNYYNSQTLYIKQLFVEGTSLTIDDFISPSFTSNLPGSPYVNVHVDSIVESSMNITAPAFYESSDIKLKENIKSINSIDYSKLENINFKEFNFKKNPIKKYGVIAQDLEKVGLGNLVKGEEGSKSVDYISLLILEIQRLRNEIEDIKKQIPTNALNVKGS